MTTTIEDALFEQRMLGLGFEKHGDDGSFARESGDLLFLIEESGDDEWWLTMVCTKEAPRMEFSGTLEQCVFLADDIDKSALFDGASREKSVA